MNNMEYKYLFYVTDFYAFSILEPLKTEILSRGDSWAWYIEEGCDRAPALEDRILQDFEAVDLFNPTAVFAPGNYIPDFFPGIKVCLFHGYPINKRKDKIDDHFKIRDWFDIYCTQGPSSTIPFKEIEKKKKTFKVYETGWAKADTYFSKPITQSPKNGRITILYSSTFTQSLTSTAILADTIEKSVAENIYDWIFMFHPKLTDKAILQKYKSIAERYTNAQYYGNTYSKEAMIKADVMLCDSSSIMLEFMFMDKPVVAFRNPNRENHLINISKPEEVATALAYAITRPKDIMQKINNYTLWHEPHRDGNCCKRILDVVEEFIISDAAQHLKKKSCNLIRKIKIRKKLHFPLFKRLF